MALTAQEKANFRAGASSRAQVSALLGATAYAAAAMAGVLWVEHLDVAKDHISALRAFITVAGVVIATLVFLVYLGIRRSHDSLPLVYGADAELRRRVRAALRVGYSDDRVINSLIRDQRDFVVPRDRLRTPLFRVLTSAGLIVMAALERSVIAGLMLLALAAVMAVVVVQNRLTFRRLRDYAGRRRGQSTPVEELQAIDLDEASTVDMPTDGAG